MKWSVIALVALGTVAALCATVLVGALRSSGNVEVTESDTQARETTIVLAARNLPQGLLLKSDALAVRQISISGAPENFIADPVLAAGKILRTAVVKDQPILTSDFAEGPGLRVAVGLPPGMLAVGISLGGSSGLQGLLYSGCNVDVLATTKGGRGSAPQTRILLECVRVLRIEGETTLSPKKTGASPGRSSRRNEVLLMLDAKQARVLRSAEASGTISLVMRNPLDEATASMEEQPEDETVAQQQPEPEDEEAEEHVTEEINGGKRETVTYIKRGDTWQRKEN